MIEPSGEAEAEPPSARRSIFTKLLVAATVGVLIWWALPGVPRDQTVVFALGEDSRRISRLEINWEQLGTDHAGQLTLNFPGAPAPPARADSTTSAPGEAPSPVPREPGALDGAPESASRSSTPPNVVHQFRLPDGEYSFRVSARRTGVGSERTEVTRRVTLNGNTLILRLEELTR